MRATVHRAIKPHHKSHFIASLLSFLVGLSTAITALGEWPKLAVDFGLMPSDRAVLAEESARGDFLREIMRLMTTRLFWAERYTSEVISNFPQPELDEAWRQYTDSVIEWNKNYLLNSALAGKYFGLKYKETLQNINWSLTQSNNCMNKIHYVSLYGKDRACGFSGTEKWKIHQSDGTAEQNLALLNEALSQIGAEADAYVNSISK